ncbi:MAG: hypothetical protein KMY55_10200 [Dethiosulfatibacter sp.]|nr:hypothetical protein [Dethiosulfatibacter sp.]
MKLATSLERFSLLMVAGRHNRAMANPDKLFVRVKLCGNCNPYYDVKLILKRIKQSLDYIEFVYKDDQYFDLYLNINGCISACIEKIDTDKPVIQVNGYIINGEECEGDTLSSCLIETLKNHLSK